LPFGSSTVSARAASSSLKFSLWQRLTRMPMVHEQSDPLCPVCVKPIEAKHSVTIDHGEVVHAECWGKPPLRRPRPVRRF